MQRLAAARPWYFCLPPRYLLYPARVPLLRRLVPVATLSPHTLLARIADLQSPGDGPYAPGLFPSQRTYSYAPSYEVEDDNVFFTAVIVYTLQRMRERLSRESQQLVDTISARARVSYPRYQNKQGQKMYNFWQVHPTERFFPNGGVLSRFRHFRLPEDIDTTSYVYLTQPHSGEDLQWLKQRLVLDTNRNRRQVQNTLPKYRHLRAYSTWLGQANMPIDFDACAMSNLLLVIFKHQLPLNEHDEDTIGYLRMVLRDGDYADHPFRVAPHYPRPALILYHVARLVGTHEVPGLSGCRPLLVEHLRRQGRRTSSFMDRVLLSTSLMRLGEPPLVTSLPAGLDEEIDRFSFFIGGLLTVVDNPVTRFLAPSDLFHLQYRCRAHSLALLLEHEVYRLNDL